MDWQKQINKVWQGDCLEMMKEMPDKCVDLVVTDPPYIVGAKGCGLAGDRAYLKQITQAKIDYGFNLTILDEILRVLKKVNLIVFCSKAQIKQYIDWSESNSFNWVLITWNKNNPTPLTNNNYLPDTEYIFHIWKDKKLGGSYLTKKRFYVTNVEKNDFQHPTIKPLSIISNLLQNGSNKGDLVFDPFMGSWTTAVACKQLGRNFIGAELSKEYCEIGEQRLRQQMLL